MSNLKSKRVIALLSIVALFLFIVSIMLIGSNDKYKGLVKVSNTSIESKLLGSIGNAALEDNTVNGNSTIEYIVSFTLDEIAGVETRDAIIKGSLTDEEFKYARFKTITGSNIESILEDNGKGIEVRVNNVRLGQEKTIKLKLVIENAPSTVEIHPSIKISESTGSYTNLDTDTVTVETNSLEGTVKDAKDLPVKNVEVVVRKNGKDVKKAYTNQDGKFVITDLEAGTYELDVDEDNYEAKKETVEVNGRCEKDLKVRVVEPYTIETHKYITRLKLIIDGREQTYTYQEKEKVLESIKAANEIRGEIEYKLVVKNVGEKEGIISKVEDIASDGLTLKDGNNGWEEVDGSFFYRPLEGVTLKKNETREIGLVLNIESTSAAKTYINKMTTKGEVYEKVVYILDGEVYKEINVLEGETLDEPEMGEGFSGWYTDKVRSNKYNFSLPVTKDLILYGVTEETKFNVRYIVEGEVYQEVEVEKNDNAEDIVGPDKEGKTFDHWSETENGDEFDFSTPITENLDLYGVYEVNKYNVTFISEGVQYGDVEVVEHGNKATAPEENPKKQYYSFKHWSLEEDGEAYNFNTPITESKTLYAVFERIKYNVKFIDDGETISNEQVDAGSIIVPIPVAKEGYTFKRWSEEPNGAAYDFSAPLTKNLTLYSVYEINQYTVTFMSEGSQYGEIETVNYNTTATAPEENPTKQYYSFKHWSLEENGPAYNFSTPVKNSFTLYAVFERIQYNVKFIDDGNVIRDEQVNAGTVISSIPVSKTGYTFKHWSETQNGEAYDFSIPLTKNLTLYSVYEINQYTVTFMSEGSQYGEIETVNYNTTATAPETDPTKEYYSFKHWSLEDGGSAYDFSTPVTDNITLYAVFERIKYNVKFIDDGNLISDEEVNAGSIIFPIPVAKVGYTFKHWSETQNGEAYDFSKPLTKNLTLYSIYEINKYNVEFYNEGTLVTTVQKDYNSTLTNEDTPTVTKEGYTFTFWSLEGETTGYDFSTPITGNIKLNSNYTIQSRQVTFNDENRITNVDIDWGTTVSPIASKGKTGYTFSHWSLEPNGSAFDFSTVITEPTTLYAVYTVNTYNITYNLDGGSATNPGTYTIETETFVLNNPTKDHYEFIGWTEGQGELTPTASVVQGSTGDKVFTAHYTATEYSLTYNYNGGELEEGKTNPSKFTVESENITLNNPTKEGYTFVGWNDGTETKNPYVIEQGSYGAKTLTAEYQTITYNITYNLDGGSATNPGTYTIETETFVLNNPTKDHYEFTGWTEGQGELTPTASVAKGSTGDKVFTAHYTATEYSLTYNYNGGELEEGKTNPSKFTVESENITLNNPSKEGYTFVGWNDGTETKNPYVIEQGSYGAKTLTAEYQTITYNITYNLDGGSVSGNPSTYTIESADITLNNPSKTGYTFVGWTEGEENPTNPFIITQGSTGNKTITAHYTPVEYTITYVLNGGSLDQGVTNPESYTIESESITINNPSKTGYTFTGWNDGTTSSKPYVIEQGSTGNKTLEAEYSINQYTVTFMDGETQYGEVQDVNYNGVATAPETNPSKTGYTFSHWSLTSGGSAYNFSTPITGNIVLYSVYTINSYTITFMDGETQFALDHADYNDTVSAPSTNPTKAHNIFLGWTLDGNPYNFSTPITHDITLYSSYELVEAPSISHTPTTWTKDSVTVTITSEHQDYTYYYNIDGGQNIAYIEPFVVTNNATVNAYSVKSGVASAEAAHDISNFDRINPTIVSLTNTAVTPVTATISIDMKDDESGLNNYKVYVNNVLTYTREAFSTNVTEEMVEEYTVTGLEEINDYTIKVEVYDKVGNMSYDTIQVTTPAKHYVARIISSDGVDLDPSAYIRFESLGEALADSSCSDTCTIQMIDDVEESNIVLNGQHITLDINGYTIEGTSDNTITNNGELKVIDNAQTPGVIYSNGVGIYNTGLLIVGNNESPAPSVVSTTAPVIEGTTYGVQSVYSDQGRGFEFYDGKIIGNVAVRGDVTETPYLYNTTVKDDATLNKQVETLVQLAEAEARIRSTYYTKVQGGIDDSKNGSFIDKDEKTPIKTRLEHDGDYRFFYNEETDQVISANQYVSNSVAHSYIKLDLTNYLDDQLVTINAEISSQGNNDIGYVYITESTALPDLNNTEGRIFAISGEVAARDYVTKNALSSGNTYYIHLIYSKNANTNSGKDWFIINDIYLGEYKTVSLSELSNADFQSYSSYYFVKDQDGSYVNNNKGVSNSSANSFIAVDLTNVSEEPTIGIEASVSSEVNNDVGYVTITNNSDAPSFDYATNRRIYISGDQARKRYLVKLIPNQVNYIHFGYRKDSSGNPGDDEFRIYSIYTLDDLEPVTTDGEVHNKETYHFDAYDYEPNEWKDLSNHGNNGSIVGATLNSNEDGFVFDGNDYVRVGQINQTEFTWQATFNATGTGTIIANYEDGGVGIKVDTDGRLKEEIFIDGAYRNLYTTNAITYGTDYTLTMTLKDGVAKLYLDGILQDSYSGTTLKHPDNNTIVMLGAGPGGNNPDGNYFNGTIYSAKIYSRELSDDEISGTASDNGLILYLDATNFKVPLSYSKYVSNNHDNSSVANSYLIFDLTNSAEDVELYANVTISSEGGYDYGYITVTDSADFPTFDQSEGQFYRGSGSSTGEYSITLTAGRINYLHMGYRKDGSGNFDNDRFVINCIKYFESSDSKLPVYVIGGIEDEISGTHKVVKLNEDVDTVQILRDITLTNPLEIVETRDVVLDLNGYTLTTSKDDYVVKNKGNLKIIDSKYEKEKAYNHSNYEATQALYDAEYNAKLAQQTSFIEDLQDQYDQEYNDAVAEYNATGGESGGSEIAILLNSDNFTAADYGGSSYNPIYLSRAYSNTQAVVRYNQTIDSSTFNSIAGSLSYWNDYGDLNIGKLMIGLSTTNENRMDDFVSYQEFDIDSMTENIVTYNIPTPATPGNYYFKAVLYHNTAVSAYTVYMKIYSMNLYGAPVRKNANDKVIENASEVYDPTDVVSDGLLVNFDSKNQGSDPDTWVDISGNNNSFTLTNVSINNSGLFFNTSNSDASLTNQLNIGEEETVELLINPNNTNNQIVYLGASNEKIEFGVYSGYIIVSTTSNYTFDLPSNYADGKIKLFTIVYKDGEYSLYCNGEPLSKRTNSDYWTPLSSTTLGHDSGGGSRYNGYIYGIRVYDRALYSEEITKNYNVSIANYNFGDMKRPLVTEVPSTINGTITSTTNSVILNDVSGYLNVVDANVTLDKSGEYSVIVNRGKLTLGEGAILNAKQSSNRGITNTISGDILDGSGTINTLSSSNIGLLNESKIDNIIKGYKITTVSNSSYDFYNNGEHEMTLDDMLLTGNGMAIYQNRDFDLTINNSAVHTKNPNTNSTETYYSNESGVQTTVTFNNCDIVGRIFNRQNSNRKIVVNDSTSSTWSPSYNYFNFYNYQGTLEINNSTLYRDGNFDQQLIDNGGTLIVNDSILNQKCYGYANGRLISNWNTNAGRGNATITNTVMNFDSTYEYDPNGYYSLYNYGDMVIDGGSLNSDKINRTGIYNDATGDLTIKGEFELSNFVRGVNNNGTLTLGDNEEPVSKEYPLITATNEAINGSNSSVFNFYDGKLIGELEITINSIVNDVPTNYDLDVEKNDKEIITLGPIVGEDDDGVCKIGNTKYKSIQAAVDAVPTNGTQTEIELLKDIYTARTVEIPSTKNVLLNQKNFGIKAYKEDTYITNDGILSFTDDTNEVTASNTFLSSKFIVNNNELNYDKVTTSSLKTGLVIENTAGSTATIKGGLITSENQRQLIDNSGTLSITGGKVSETVSSDSVANMIVNNANSTMAISGGTIEKKNTGSATVSNAINNAGTLTVTGGNFILQGYYGYFKSEGGKPITAFRNESTGTVTVTGGNFNNGETQRSSLIDNAGTASISNITSDFTHVGKNTGTLTLDNVVMNNMITDTASWWLYGSGYLQTGLLSEGTLNVTGGSYTYTNTEDGSDNRYSSAGTNAAFTLGTGTIDFDSVTITTNARGIALFNSGSLTVDDSTIASGTAMSIYHSSTATINDSSFSATGTGISASDTANYYLTDTNVVTTNGYGLDTSTSGNITINGGSIIGTTNGINNTGTSTITIGNKDGSVSMTEPEITGTTAGLNNSNTNATINFYDGIISGSTAINGKIADIEPGYDIILETDTMEHKFLDIRPLVENTRTHEQYDTVQAGIDAASNGDTLQFLRENTTTPDTATIVVPSGKTVTIDINGFKIYKNNEQYIINNGTLTLDDSQTSGTTYGGQYIINSVGDFIENNGTLNLNSVDIYQKENDEVIVNNSTGTVNLVSEQIISELQYTLITNSGTMNISGGKISETIARDGASDMIVNNENATLNITDGVLQKENSGSLNDIAISNSGILDISGGTFLMRGRRPAESYDPSRSLRTIRNNSTGVVTITAGNFNNDISTDNYRPAMLIDNEGIATISDINSNYNNIGINSGTITLTNLTMENLKSTTNYRVGFLDEGFRNNGGTALIIGGLFRYGGGFYEKPLFNAVNGELTVKSTETHAGKTFNNSETSNSILNVEDCEIYGSQVFYLNKGTITNVKDSIINASSDIVLMYGNDYYGNPTFNMENSSMITTSDNGIKAESTTGAVINVKSGSITATGAGITNNGTATINVLSGTITSGSNAINNSGVATITIGTQGDGTVSKIDPEISGTTVGLNNTNSNATINFYDGIIKGNTAIVGSVTEVEPNYEIIQDTEGDKEVKYLDKLPIVENTTTHIQYDTIQEGVTAASNGDTLLVLRQLTVLPSDGAVTIPSGKTVTIDLGGQRIITNNSLFIENNGTLIMTDSSTGGTISSNSSQIFNNTGTLNITGGSYEKLYDGSRSLLVNTGVVNISDGTMTTNVPSAITLINNSNELNISGGNITPSYTRAIQNTGITTITGGVIKKLNGYDGGNGYNSVIFNDTNSQLIINSTSGEITNNGYGDLIQNNGTLTVTNGNFSNNTSAVGNTLFINTGSATISGGSYGTSSTRIVKRFFSNSGTMNVSNVDFYSTRGMSASAGTLTFNDVNIDIAGNGGDMFPLNGSSNFTATGGSITMTGDVLAFYFNDSNVSTFNNVPINIDGTIYIFGGTNATFNGGSITNTNTNRETIQMYYSSNLTFDHGFVLNSYKDAIYTGTYGATAYTGTINIKDASIKSTANAGINNTTPCTIIIGELGGTPSGTTPSIIGHTYGLNNTNNNANIYFYDGIISGETSSIYGTIRDVEPGYKEVRNPNTIDDVQYTSSTLSPLGTEDTVVVVNNTNFASLQSAVNYAVANEIPTISLQKDYALEADLVKPTGIDVYIYTNGRTLTTTGYTVSAGINIVNGQAPSGLTGAIYKIYADITGSEINAKNVLIYQMEDGSVLLPNKTYKLYELERGNYNIVKFSEESIGEYRKGGSIEQLSTVKGRLYLNGLGQGQYKLVGSDNKEIDFEVYDDGVSDNVRISDKEGIEQNSESVAMVILTFSTGVFRSHYIIYILLVIIIVLSLIAIKKSRKELNE